jgi:hypothetical protein
MCIHPLTFLFDRFGEEVSSLLFTGEKDVLNMWVWKMQEILFFCTLSA